MARGRAASPLRSSCAAAADGWRSVVAQVGIPVRPAPLGREVEEVPEGIGGVAVAGILARIGRFGKKFGAPEAAKDGGARRVAATASVGRRSSISCCNNPLRAWRYSTDSLGTTSRVPPPVTE